MKMQTITVAALLISAGEASALARNSLSEAPQTPPTALAQLLSATPGQERVEVPDVPNIVVAQMPDARQSIAEQEGQWARNKEGGDSTVDEEAPDKIKTRERAGSGRKTFHESNTSQNLIWEICVAAEKCPMKKSFSELAGKTFAELGFTKEDLRDFCTSEQKVTLRRGICPDISSTLAEAARSLSDSYQVAVNSGMR